MDRNLGALTVASIAENETSAVTSYGLLYQWGRKDPFIGAKYNTTKDLPGYTHAEGMDFSISSGKITLDHSIQHPMEMGWEAYNKDWCTEETTSETLWSDSEKTIYDPCPSGYRVMKRDNSNTELWADSNSGDLTQVTGWAVDATKYGFTFGSPAVTFPLAGYKDGDLKTASPGTKAGVWSSKRSDANYAYMLNIRTDTNPVVYTRSGGGRARAYSVRCVAE
jgi:uncharacterized protein (TIGR02145 family)